MAPVVAYVKQVRQEEYDRHIESAIKKGVQSIIAVLRRKPPAIPDAFHHPSLGPIGLDFEGAKHVVDERKKQYPGDDTEATTARVLYEVAKAAILGKPQEDPARGDRKTSRVAIVHKWNEVIVEPNWRTKHPEHAHGQTLWVVTGYRMDEFRKKRRADESEPMAIEFQNRQTK